MKRTTIIFALALPALIQAQPSKLPFQLEKGWEVTVLKNPESVVLDAKAQVLYVSNVNGTPTDKDGNGYISKLSLDGKILEEKWVAGLDAPKGLAIYGGKLYVADIDQIVEIDLTTKKSEKFNAEGATFLNDLAADGGGNIYASNTFGFSGIYKLSVNGERKVELWLKDNALNMPNGLYVVKNQLMVAGWGAGFNPETYATETPGHLLQVDLKTKKVELVSQPIGNLDGLSQTLHGYFVTDWLKGTLYYWANDTATEVMDLPQGSADICFDKATKTLYIPLMMDNRLLTYRFKN